MLMLLALTLGLPAPVRAGCTHPSTQGDAPAASAHSHFDPLVLGRVADRERDPGEVPVPCAGPSCRRGSGSPQQPVPPRAARPDQWALLVVAPPRSAGDPHRLELPD